MGNYKHEILSAFLRCSDICELMFDKKPYTENDAKNLMYTQIFPYLYKEEAQTAVLPYLCVEADISAIPTHTVKDMKLILWAYCHKDAMEYSAEGYSGTRVDILADMAERQLRTCTRLGIGKLQLQSASYFLPADHYYGKELVFSVPEFKISR